MHIEDMTDDEIIKKFKLFTHPEKVVTLNQLAFSGTQIYATDGRIAVDGRLSTAHPEEIPEKYPIKTLREILEGPRAATAWFAFKIEEFHLLDELFKDACKDELNEQLRNCRTRYTEEICPCCDKTVYWDSWNEELVLEKETAPVFDWRDVNKSTWIRFANGESVLVGFCYLHLMVQTFGNDLRLAIGYCTDEKNPMLYMKTADDRFYGALMPLRSYDSGYTADFTLHAESVV